MYDPVTIFIIVLGLFFVCLFLLLCFLCSISICYKASLVVLNSLNFCLPGKLLIYPSHLNESLEMNVICQHCYWQIQTNIVNKCYLPFSLVIFNILSLIFVSLNTMSLYVPPQVYPAWDSLCFLDLADYFLSHVREIFSFYLFQYFLSSFLSPPSGRIKYTYNVNAGTFNVVPEVSQAVFLLFHFLPYILVCGSDFHRSVF